MHTDHDQRITGSAGAIRNAWEGGRLSTAMPYGSGLRRGLAATEKVDPYGALNVGPSQDFIGPDRGRWTARIGPINVFDSIYHWRDGTGIGRGAPRHGTRRGVFAGLSRDFREAFAAAMQSRDQSRAADVITRP